MNKQKSDLIKMIVWVAICVTLMLSLWLYSICTHQDEKKDKQQHETTLVTPEDSVHFYEDGM